VFPPEPDSLLNLIGDRRDASRLRIGLAGRPAQARRRPLEGCDHFGSISPLPWSQLSPVIQHITPGIAASGMKVTSAYADVMLSIAEVEQSVRGADPDAGLRAVARLRQLTEQLEAAQVAAAREAGWSWQEIAARLGVTKQTVHRKYRHELERR